MDTLEYAAQPDEKKLKELECQLEQQTKELNQALNSIAELGDQTVPFPVDMLEELKDMCTVTTIPQKPNTGIGIRC